MLSNNHKIERNKEKGKPGAVAHEDAFPYSQCAVVPHQ